MLRELGPFSLEKRRLRITLMSINTWKESAKRTDSSVVLTSSTKRNGQKLEHKRFPLNIRKHFSVQMTVHWQRLPREILESTSLEILKNCMEVDTSLSVCALPLCPTILSILIISDDFGTEYLQIMRIMKTVCSHATVPKFWNLRRNAFLFKGAKCRDFVTMKVYNPWCEG